MLAYDTTDQSSFAQLKQHLIEVDRYSTPEVSILLVGTKCDIGEKRQVPFETGRAFAEEQGIAFIETSAKEGVNVDEAFSKMAERCIETAATAQRMTSQQGPEQPKLNLAGTALKVGGRYCSVT